MRREVMAGIIAAIVVVVAVGAYVLVSPLFIATEVNEPIPSELASTEFQQFMSMSEEERAEAAEQMTDEEKEMVMTGAAQTSTSVDENVAGMSEQEAEQAAVTEQRSGSFVGVGGHAAEGIAKILSVNGEEYLRFEQFSVTNGPIFMSI